MGKMPTFETLRRVRIVRLETTHRPKFSEGSTFRRLLPLAISVLALTGLTTTPALAASSGSSTATINVAPAATRSMTVSPTTFTFSTNCAGGLTFPNGVCDLGTFPSSAKSVGGITVANTGAAGHIDVNGANAIPSDAGTAWILCDPAAPVTCTGSGSIPGANQFDLSTTGWNGTSGTSSTNLSSTPACDSAFNAGNADKCSAATGASQVEEISLVGPTSTTDTSSSFTTIITWTAVP